MLILSVIGMLIVLWGSIVAFVAAWFLVVFFLSPPGYVVFLIVEWDAAKKSLWRNRTIEIYGKQSRAVRMLGGRTPDGLSAPCIDGDIDMRHITVSRSAGNNNCVRAICDGIEIRPIGFTSRKHMMQVRFGIGIISALLVGVKLRNGDGRQYPDDGDHDQQFDQGETLFAQRPGFTLKIGKSACPHLSKSPLKFFSFTVFRVKLQNQCHFIFISSHDTTTY